MSLSSRIIKATPVGNPDLWESPPPAGYIGGTLRNSWHASRNAVSSEGAREPDADAGGTGSESSVAAGTMGLELGDTFYLTNNMPYAQSVEDGWSSQAPQGMVKSTLAGAKPEAESKFRG